MVGRYLVVADLFPVERVVGQHQVSEAGELVEYQVDLLIAEVVAGEVQVEEAGQVRLVLDDMLDVIVLENEVAQLAELRVFENLLDCVVLHVFRGHAVLRDIQPLDAALVSELEALYLIIRQVQLLEPLRKGELGQVELEQLVLGHRNQVVDFKLPQIAENAEFPDNLLRISDLHIFQPQLVHVFGRRLRDSAQNLGQVLVAVQIEYRHLSNPLATQAPTLAHAPSFREGNVP